MQIKWNWGTKIFLAYSVFVAGMLFLVFLCTQQHFDLVRSDYYEAEIAFQQQLSSNERSKALAVQPQVTLQDGMVHIILPSNIDLQKGDVFFYKPDNASLDKKFGFTSTQLDVPVSTLGVGAYTVKINWVAGENSFYHEENIFISKKK